MRVIAQSGVVTERTEFIRDQMIPIRLVDISAATVKRFKCHVASQRDVLFLLPLRTEASRKGGRSPIPRFSIVPPGMRDAASGSGAGHATSPSGARHGKGPYGIGGW